MIDPELDAEVDDDEAPESPAELRAVELTVAGERIDRALAAALPDLSRARLQALMTEGRVRLGGKPVTNASAKSQAGVYEIAIPAPAAAEPEPESIPLTILFEDEHLIVVDKPAGMAAHPGPGTPSGTLVNALLAHCGAGLSGIGGVARPGIVHRLDKDTSGVMVAAKTDAAHQGLTRLFAAHDIDLTAPQPPEERLHELRRLLQVSGHHADVPAPGDRKTRADRSEGPEVA